MLPVADILGSVRNRANDISLPRAILCRKKTKHGLETGREIYSGCREGAEVALYSVVGGGQLPLGAEALWRL